GAADTELEARAGGELEERFYGYDYSQCYGPCPTPYEYGCLFDGCYYHYDVLYYYGYCVCCRVSSLYQC
ncbi:hypothetical protein FHG87_023431, partial [Trinorchestia longiramus]